jgi:hypothetical protein
MTNQFQNGFKTYLERRDLGGKLVHILRRTNDPLVYTLVRILFQILQSVLRDVSHCRQETDTQIGWASSATANIMYLHGFKKKVTVDPVFGTYVLQIFILRTCETRRGRGVPTGSNWLARLLWNTGRSWRLAVS